MAIPIPALVKSLILGGDIANRIATIQSAKKQRHREVPSVIGNHTAKKKLNGYARRSLRIETLENRKLLAADPIHVGVVYLETDYLESDVGSDSQGDRFLLSFTGGAPGTRLTELTIRTDKDGDGISVGDPIYDTALGGRGKNGAHGFQITPGQSEQATAVVEDGGQELTLRFTDFVAGDRLEFTLDVDEVLRNVADLELFNQRLDVITSGQEFQDSILHAVFDAPNYHQATAEAIFINDYGDPADQFGLNLPPDESDDVDSLPNRSAAAVGSVTQTPQVASVSGFVYRDDNDSGTRDAGEVGLAGIEMRLQPIDTIEPQAVLTTYTLNDGSYRFDQLMPGRYHIVQVEQPADLSDGRDAAGTISGRVVGSAINPGDEIRDVVLSGGDAGIQYNFGELPLGSITGSVYLAPPGQDCYDEHGPGTPTPLADVVVQLQDAGGGVIATTTTDSQGRYLFDQVLAGTYRVVEITPEGLIDGGSHVGNIRTLADEVLVGIGSSVSGGRIDDVTLPAGGAGHEYDFCEAAPASLSGHVYHDQDNDGRREAGEEPIAGTTLRLVNSNNQTVATTQTDNSGYYEFAGLVADTYRIVEVQPAGYIDGRDTVGQIDGQTVGRFGSDSDSLVDIVLRQGLHGVDYDFGERKVASLAGRVHVDLDEDCYMDENEQPLAGVIIHLLDESGRTVATTQTDQEGRYHFDNLTPGNYTVVEQQPIGYFEGGAKPGSTGGVTLGPNRIGQVTLSSGEVAVDYDFCERPPAEISGVVYLDRDADCVRDPGERGLDGVTVQLLDGDGNLIATTQTLADGTYRFTNLPAGEYQVRELQPAGWIQGGQVAGSHGGDDSQTDLISSVPISWGDSLTEYNFCERPPAEISGVVYLDQDADCVRDPGEPGLEGVTIQLLDRDGNLIATTQTLADGTYRFTDLPAGEYQVRELQPAGLIHGGQIAGSHGGDDSQTDLISSVPIAWGDSLTQYNFCELQPSEISGVVYVDRDADCIRDFDEVGLSGVIVELFDEAGRLVDTTQTGTDGSYRFTNLPAGNYTIRETQPQGYYQGGQKAGTGGGNDQLTDTISQIPLGWGTSLVNYDFCERLPSTLAGKVWSDVDADGVFDPGEVPIAGVLIELTNDANEVVGVTRTDADGCYEFTNLPPDTYTVSQTQPAGYFQGGQIVGDQGGIVLRPDVLGEIVLLGSVDAREYNFPELPPAKLSGYVYQDGENLVMQDAPPAEDLRDFRDGQLTADDTRLAGVRIELRDVQGLPVASLTGALPGIYDDEVIYATTDANGYYEFSGLRPLRTYSVFQIQPTGFIDSLDTAGSTGGVAINRADLSDLQLASVVSSLSNGVDPAFDAIVQVVLNPGQSSVSNNFSEIAIEDPPVVPPASEDPPEVMAPTVPIVTFPSTIRPLAFGQPIDVRPPMVAFDEWAVSWHLSVINGGFPRGDAPISGLLTQKQTGVKFQQASFGPADDYQKSSGLPDELINVELASGRWQVLGQDQSGIELGHEDAIALMGDFDGDGIDEAALFLAGRWYIDLNGNGIWDAGDLWVRLGTAMDRPVVGDWDGDGKDDVGIFGRRWHNDERRIRRDPGLPDPANQRRRELARVDLVHREPTAEEKRQRILARGEDGEFLADAVDHVFQYGEQVDTPLSGDWNGNGIDQIGVFRGGQWLLDEDGDGRWTHRDRPITFGRPGDEPIVGDFNGDGIDEIGVVRGDLWIIDSDGDRRITGNDQQIRVPRNSPDSQPIVGDFDGDERDDPGYYDAS